jgi:hypothetical protein
MEMMKIINPFSVSGIIQVGRFNSLEVLSVKAITIVKSFGE